jgi:tRNA 2-thiouridine synthesizing protein A
MADVKTEMTASSEVARTPADLTLDTSGMCCPMPIVATRQAIDRIEVGQTMEVIATDPGSRVDIPAWAANTGHELLDTEQDDGTFRFRIRRTR